MVQVALLGVCDHSIGENTHLLSSGNCRHDSFVLNERRDHVSEHGKTMGGVQAQLSESSALPHVSFLCDERLEMLKASKVL